MKHKLLLLTLAALLFGYCDAYAQPELNVVWENNVDPSEIVFAKFSKDGKWIYRGFSNTIDKINPLTGEFVSSFNNTGASTIYVEADMSETGNYILTGENSQNLCLWDLANERIKKYINMNVFSENPSYSVVAISPDEKYIIAFINGTTNPNKNALVKYDIEKDSVVLKLIDAPIRYVKIKYSPDGKYIAVGMVYYSMSSPYPRTELELLNPEDFSLIAVLENVDYNIPYRKLEFSRNGKYLGCLKQWNLKVFDMETKKMVYSTNENLECYGFGFYPDTDYMIIDASSQDTSIITQVELPSFNETRRIGLKGAGYITEFYKYNDESILALVSNGIFSRVFSNKSVSVQEDEQTNFTIKSEREITITAELEILKVTIVDSSGKIIHQKDISSNPKNNYTIENTFPTGTYICTITTIDGKTYSKAFQVVR